jgi:hypothetical protein
MAYLLQLHKNRLDLFGAETHYLLEKQDIKRLQYFLGHNNVHDTRKLYGEVLEKKSKTQFFQALNWGNGSSISPSKNRRRPCIRAAFLQ